MKTRSIITAIVALALGGSLHAGFVNGGFEDGTFNGWTVKQGFNNAYGGYNILHDWYGVNGVPNNNPDPLACVGWGQENRYMTAPVPSIMTKSTFVDGYVPDTKNMFIGDKMAKLNDITNGFHVTQISQTGQINAADYFGGTSATLYVNWAGVMENPGHPHEEDPWFIIGVMKNGSLVAEERHYSEEPGWTYSNGVYYGMGQFTLGGLLAGDEVSVILTVADCAQGGHGAYAYLDGIGTAYVPPPNGVPDATSTLGLLGAVVLALGLIRRRMV